MIYNYDYNYMTKPVYQLINKTPWHNTKLILSKFETQPEIEPKVDFLPAQVW